VTYIYQPQERLTFAEGVAALRGRGRQVVERGVDITAPQTIAAIRQLGLQAGLPFQDFAIDLPAFQAYVASAGYTDRYREYYVGNQTEKSLEHFIAFSLLRLTPDDVFIDIASEHSPVADIYGSLSGATTYSQDIMYPAGVVDRRIGGDACAMPLPDGFASAASLTCSLEHFEQDADSRLFVELARVLKPGGAVCIVPFYVNTSHVVQTDPAVSVPAEVPFDETATVFCADGWGNRHGRFYSPQSFVDRIVRVVESAFQFEAYYLTNASSIPTVYARFALLARRR
jgi:hypothetical protein